MGGIQANRRQHRHQFAKKIFLDPFLLRGVPFPAAQKADAFGRELRQHFLVEHLILARHEFPCFFRHPAKHFAQGYAVGAARRVGGDFFLEAGHADFEKFIEVTVDDAQKAQPFERGNAAVFGERQYAVVEFKLPKLAIETELGRDVSFSHGRIEYGCQPRAHRRNRRPGACGFPAVERRLMRRRRQRRKNLSNGCAR